MPYCEVSTLGGQWGLSEKSIKQCPFSRTGEKAPRKKPYRFNSRASRRRTWRYIGHAEQSGERLEESEGGTDASPGNQGSLAELRESIPQLSKKRRRQADSSDWISSQLTRRFGLAGGLAWLGILVFGVVSEQIKTRLEDRAAQKGTKDLENPAEVQLGEGLTYKDIRVGGGESVQQGYLTVLHYRGYVNGAVFEDTRDRGKPIVFLYGSRPFTAGGIRDVHVPASLGFGETGISLRGTEHVPGKEPAADVPPNADLRYHLELLRVSIPPS